MNEKLKLSVNTVALIGNKSFIVQLMKAPLLAEISYISFILKHVDALQQSLDLVQVGDPSIHLFFNLQYTFIIPEYFTS